MKTFQLLICILCSFPSLVNAKIVRAGDMITPESGVNVLSTSAVRTWGESTSARLSLWPSALGRESLAFGCNRALYGRIQGDDARNAEGLRISLDGEWTLTYFKQPQKPVRTPAQLQGVDVKRIKAVVPGNVEIDLQNAGVIPDPMIGNNVCDLRPYEGCGWVYSRSFQAPEIRTGERLQLWFGGIDCFADVFVNGKLVGSADNMMTEHAYDISDAVNAGENSLQVIIRSSFLEAQTKLLGTFSIGNFASEESSYIRRAPHTYGWDIMPRLVSAGLWRSVELRILKAARYRDVHYYVTNVDTASRNVSMFVDCQIKMPMEKFDGLRSRVTLSRGGVVKYRHEQPVYTPAFRLSWFLPKADLWWPRGYGEPALYDAKAELVDKDGNVLDTDVKKIGLRTIRLDLNAINLPEKPGRFTFYVNNEPIFIHGTNWVPLDGLHSRDATHYDKMMSMAADLNVNMIRLWGGNVYEDSRFFDLCDSLGILVWQDFAMACNFYPQRPDFLEAIRNEVQSIVVKMRSHPSLAVWSGNNEDDAFMRWRGIDANKDKVSRGVIPEVLYEFDAIRPYLPSSPYYSEEVYKHGDFDNVLTENHLWGPRGYYKDPYYKSAKAIFCSEIGYHGCPNLESLKKMFTKNCVYPWEKDFQWNEEWLTKSVRRYPSLGKTNDRNNLMINQVRLVFKDVPKKLDDFIFASQCVQGEAMKYFLEMWRGKKFADKTGMIWWNLRDGWPLISDAIVDYYYSKKRAYYYLKNAERDVCVFINDPEDGALPLMAVNDTRAEAKGEVEVTDVESGKKVYESAFTVPRNGKTCVAKLPVPDGQGIYLIKYEVSGRKYGNHYLYGKAPYKLSDYRKWINATALYEQCVTK